VQQMEAYFFGEGAEKPKDYVPPTHWHWNGRVERAFRSASGPHLRSLRLSIRCRAVDWKPH